MIDSRRHKKGGGVERFRKRHRGRGRSRGRVR